MWRIWQVAWNKWLKTWLVPKSGFKKWQKPWNTGKTWTYKLTESHKKNIWKAWLWRKQSWETKLKISLSKRWEKCYNWNWWITKINKSIRSLFEYRQWRSDVFTRDWFVCVECWSKKQIQAHHIKWLWFIVSENNIKTNDDARLCAELWNINNWITLCSDCHKQTDNYWPKAKKNV
jgi:5-methylcytosine-specific restriction endonuclease McrA